MSLFRDEVVHVARIKLEPHAFTSGVGSNATTSSAPPGSIWYDNTTGSFLAETASGITVLAGTQPVGTIAAAAVTNTNATTATALQTFAFQPGQINSVGKHIYVFAAGEYTTDSGTARTMTISLTIGDGTNTRTLVTFTSDATTASSTGYPWNFDAHITVQASGTSGTLFAHGTLNIALGTTSASAIASYNDVNTAVTSAVDLTKTDTLTVKQLFSGSNTGNTFTQDMLVVEY